MILDGLVILVVSFWFVGDCGYMEFDVFYELWIFGW